MMHAISPAPTFVRGYVDLELHGSSTNTIIKDTDTVSELILDILPTHSCNVVKITIHYTSSGNLKWRHHIPFQL